jgi:hypothetical protein
LREIKKIKTGDDFILALLEKWERLTRKGNDEMTTARDAVMQTKRGLRVDRWRWRERCAG